MVRNLNDATGRQIQADESGNNPQKDTLIRAIKRKIEKNRSVI